MFGNEEDLAKNPIYHLFDVYVKVNKAKEKNPSINNEANHLFKLMESGMILVIIFFIE